MSPPPIVKDVLLQALKVTAAAGDSLHRPRRGVTVLIYHRVGRRTPVEVDLPSDLFDRQMAALAESGCVITLDDALVVLADPEAPPHDPVVVTFDDGTADFADVAVPILERHRIPATLYVATDFIEQRRPFPDDGLPLSWAALRDTLSTGLITVGSHTHTHALLDRVDGNTAHAELTTSIGLINDRLGVGADHFAYPKALVGSPAAEAAVRRRFRSAVIGGGRPNPYGHADTYRLTRSALQVADGMRWFRRKASGGMALEEVLRRRLNGRRYSAAVS